MQFRSLRFPHFSAGFPFLDKARTAIQLLQKPVLVFFEVLLAGGRILLDILILLVLAFKLVQLAVKYLELLLEAAGFCFLFFKRFAPIQFRLLIILYLLGQKHLHRLIALLAVFKNFADLVKRDLKLLILLLKLLNRGIAFLIF